MARLTAALGQTVEGAGRTRLNLEHSILADHKVASMEGISKSALQAVWTGIQCGLKELSVLIAVGTNMRTQLRDEPDTFLPLQMSNWTTCMLDKIVGQVRFTADYGQLAAGGTADVLASIVWIEMNAIDVRRTTGKNQSCEWDTSSLKAFAVGCRETLTILHADL